MKNPFANLNWADLGKGLLILAVSTMMASLAPIFQEHGWPTWAMFEPILQTTLAAMIVYIIKNMFTNPVTLIRSSFGKLDIRDILWGLLITVGSFVLSSLVDILQSGWPTWEAFKPILFGAVAAGITYIMKNVVTNNENDLLKKDPVN